MKKKSILFAVPALIIYTALMVLPMIIVFASSFTDWDGATSAFHVVGLENYIRMFSDSRFLGSVKNTIQMAGVIFIAVNLGGLILALLLNRGLRMTNLYRSIFFIPTVLSSVAITFAFSGLFSYTGIINTFLTSIGLETLQQDWLGTRSNAILSIELVEIWRTTGYYMIIYLAALQTVPKDLYEACEIDGGGEWTKIKSVTLPMIVPGITICCILSAMNVLRLFDAPMILTGGGPQYGTETMVMNIFKRSLSQGQFGYGSALAFVLFLVIVIVSLIQIKISNKMEVDN